MAKPKINPEWEQIAKDRKKYTYREPTKTELKDAANRNQVKRVNRTFNELYDSYKTIGGNTITQAQRDAINRNLRAADYYLNSKDQSSVRRRISASSLSAMQKNVDDIRNSVGNFKVATPTNFENKDFAEKSKYDSAIAKKDQDYRYINADAKTKQEMTSFAGMPNQKDGSSNDALFDAMTSNEIAEYNYIYKTKGKKEARKYLNELALGDTGVKAQENLANNWRDIAKAHPKTAEALRVVMQPAEGLSSIASMVNSAFGNHIGANENMSPSVMSGAIQREVQSGLDDWSQNRKGGNHLVVGGKDLGNLYTNAYAFGDSAARSILSSVMLGGNAMAAFSSKAAGGRVAQALVSLPISASAYGDNYYQMRNSGASDFEAKKQSIVDAGIEWATEIMGGFFGKEFGGESRLVGQALGQMTNEALEEITGDILNTGYDIIDSLMNGKQNEIQQEYADLIAQGYTSKDAMKMLLQRYATEEAITFVGTFLSMAPNVIGTTGMQYKTYRQKGNEIKNDNVTVDEVYKVANLLPEDSKSHILAQELLNNEKKNVTDAQLGELYYTSLKEIEESFENAKTLDELNEASYGITDNLTEGSRNYSVPIGQMYLDAVERIQNQGKGIKGLFNKSNKEEPTEETLEEDVTEQKASPKAMPTEESTATPKSEFKIGATSNGTPINITSVSSRNDEIITFNTIDGKTVKSTDIAITSPKSNKIIEEAIVPFGDVKMGANGINEYIGVMGSITNLPYANEQKANQDFTDKNRAAKALYNIGRYGGSVENVLNDTALTSMINMLGRDNAIAMVEAGIDDRTVSDKKMDANKPEEKPLRAKATGKFYTENEELRPIGEVIANVFKADVDFLGPVAQAPNGDFNIDLDKLEFFLDSEKGLATIGHELGEYLRKFDEEGHKVVVAAVREYLIEKLGATEYARITKGYQDKYNEYAKKNKRKPNTSVGDSEAELTNDFIGAMLFGNKYGQEAFANWLAERGDNKLINTFKNFVQSVIDLMNKLLKTDMYNEVEMAALRARKADAERLSKLILEKYKNAIAIRDELATKYGIETTESGTAVRNFSLRSWNDTDQNAIIKSLTKVGFDEDQAKKWVDDVNTVAAMIVKDRERLDYTADDFQTALKKNSEYIFTLDMSTLCKKRRLYQGTLNEIMHRLQDQVLDASKLIDLRLMLDQAGYEVPCGICYEESRKKHEIVFADRWLNGYDGKPGYASVPHKDNYIPTLDEVVTTDGKAKLRREGHTEAVESYLKYQRTRGSANPKVSFTHTDYRGEIRKLTDKKIQELKHIGGLRIQSFSDFETIQVIDMMQAILDMSAKKLTSQAYTKVPAFADIFGGTGVKINLSLIGMVDENGVLRFDAKEGINPEEAFRIRQKYSNNVGTILVGANDESILAAWADDRIDMVIPFHRSGWSEEEFERLGLKGYKDYQPYNKPMYVMDDGSVISLETAEKQGLVDFTDTYPADYWDNNLSGTENAKRYLEFCAEHHLRPEFYNFLVDNEDGTWSLQPDGSTDGYWKSLIDYKTYNNEGEIAPQQEVQPIFDMEAAKRVMDEFEGNADTLPVAQDVVEKYVKKFKNDGNRKYSLRDTDAMYDELNQVTTDLRDTRDKINEIMTSSEYQGFIERLAKPDVSDEDFNEYRNYEQSSGLADLVKKDKELDDRWKQLTSEISTIRRETAINDEKEAINKFGKGEAAYFRKQAIKEFGYTPYFYDAGYLLPNGAMLNFSGDKGQHYGVRGEDHRGIGRIYATTSGTDAMNRFMSDGNIRIMAEAPAVDINANKEPTRQQYTIIRKFIDEYAPQENYFAVDFSEDDGRRAGSLSYEGNVNTTRVINDIKHYFATGEIREQSQVDAFRYSLRDNYMKAAQSGNEAKAQKYVDEAAMEWGAYSVDGKTPLKLYHGTQSFGFTELSFEELRKKDRQNKFFNMYLTDDLATARSYAYGAGVKTLTNRLPFTSADLKDGKFWRNDKGILKYLDKLGIEYTTSGEEDKLTVTVPAWDSSYTDNGHTYEIKFANKPIMDVVIELNNRYLKDNAIKNAFGLPAHKKTTGVYQMYAKLENPFVYDAKGKYWSALNLTAEQRKALNDKTFAKILSAENRVRKLVQELLDSNAESGARQLATKIWGHDIDITYEEMLKAFEIGKATNDEEFDIITRSNQFLYFVDIAYDETGSFSNEIESLPKGDYKKNVKEQFTKDVDLLRTLTINFTTRNIVELAYKAGYDGVVFKNINDNGGTSFERVGTANHIIVPFSENAIKSADAITYDDQGNVIPLEERFQDKNELRYSLREDYKLQDNKAVMTQRRLDEEIKNSGAGSRTDYAQNWITSISPTDFLNLTSQKSVINRDRFDTNAMGDYGGFMGDYDYNNALKESRTPFLDVDIKTGKILQYDGRHRVRALEQNGIDSVEVVVSFYDDGYKVKYATDSQVALNTRVETKPSVLLRPMYFDDDEIGYQKYKASVRNVIPLNEDHREEIESTYGEKANDNATIKYSLSVDTDNTSALVKENKKLQEAVDLYKIMLGYNNTNEGAHRVNRDKIRNIANVTKRTYNSTMDADDIYDKLVEMYDYLSSGKADWNSVYDMGKRLGMDIVQSQKGELTSDQKDALNILKGYNISITDAQRSEIANYYDNVSNWLNIVRKGIKYSTTGIPLESVWGELSERLPYYFKADTVADDMPVQLAEAVESITDTSYNEYGYDDDEMAEMIAYELYQKYFELPEIVTPLDKAHKELVEERILNREKLESVKAKDKARYNRDVQRLKEYYQDMNKRLRDSKNESTLEKLAKQKAKYEDKARKQKDTRERSALRKSIRKHLNKILTMAANPTKDKHIPNSIIEGVRSLAEAVTLDGTKEDERLIEKLNNFRNGFDIALQSNENNYYDTIAMVYNGYISDRISYLVANYGNTPLKELSATALKEIRDLIVMTEGTINNMNRLFNKARTDTVIDYASRCKEEFAVQRKDKMFNGTITGFAYDIMKPLYFFENLNSRTMLELYHDLQHGEEEWVQLRGIAKDYIDNLRRQTGYNSWDFDTKQTFTTLKGEVELSLQEILAVYANSLGEHTRKNILGGGFRFENKQEKKFGFIPQKSKVDAQNKTLTIDQLNTICAALTPDQQKYVKGMIKFMSETAGEWGNQVTRQLYGVELYKEQSYYPAIVASDTRGGDKLTENIGGVTVNNQLVNSSFTYAIIPQASNPVVLKSFDEVVAKHIVDMANYRAFVLPLDNFKRVFNSYLRTPGQEGTVDYESVKGAIEEAYGTKAIKYIANLINDINGGAIGSDTDYSSKFVSLFKKGAVFASASVVVQQPSAIGRALAMLDAKYFIGNPVKGFSKTEYEEMLKYCPLAQLKELGYFDTGMAQTAVDSLNQKVYDTKMEKFLAFWTDGAYRDDALSFLAAKADEITWTHIWNACKNEARDNYPNLSEEQQKQKAAERFREVITKTQVYDSVFSRAGIMRSKNPVNKMLTSFMAEPLTSLNMTMNAVIEAKQGRMDAKQVGRTIGSLVVASTLNALLQTLVTAARHDKDDDDWKEVYLAELFPNFLDNLNPAKQIPLLRDAISLFEGYGVTRADMSLFEDLYRAVKGMQSENTKPGEKIMTLAGALAAFCGLPIKNIYRDCKAGYNILKDMFDDYHFSTHKAKELFLEEINGTSTGKILKNVFGIDIFATSKSSKFKKVFASLNKGKGQDADKWLANIRESETRNGKSEKDINSEIKAAFTKEYKKKYLEGDANTKSQIVEYMTQSGAYGSREEVTEHIRKYWKE